ncbi:hypothetical protein A8990_11650 [Paenibacillus taihuensis]|uniref:Uncharacterized protein n=1 Tax=Paenibacillus taihuensis TaxID=1156355 RepID=A0A3D9S151_9BACL|nr:hypothetical protein [Paenibacillus taihuensis]REE83871.1 hypothetical protein A8990_11650 [Paenibacillus taihuensis]
MSDNRPVDAVEDLVSFEALSAMTAALSPDEDESHKDHDLEEQQSDSFESRDDS